MNQVFRSGLLAVVFNLLFSMGAFGAGTVTSTNDSGPGSLRTVLLGGGGTINFTVDGTITLASPLNIVSSVTIDGSGHSITISGSNTVRVFTINAPITVSMINLTIANGTVTGANGGAGAAGGSAQGAGILMAGSTLNASNCLFLTNTVTGGNGGGAAVTGGNGGVASGAAIDLVNGVLNATNCQFYGNAASGGTGGASTTNNFGVGGNALGGAIHGTSSQVVLVNCAFQSNQIHGGLAGSGPVTGFTGLLTGSSGAALGGAVSVQGGSLTNLDCQFLENAGSVSILPVVPSQTYRNGVGGLAQGGAIFNSGGPLMVNRSTFTSNSLVGGESQNEFGTGGSGQGGAVFSQGLTLLNACVFGQNSTLGGSNGFTAGDGQGGAVYVNGSATISQSWFTSNTVQGGLGYVTNTFRGVSGTGKGGAVYSTNSPATNSLTIVACTFSDNEAHGISAINSGGNATAAATSGGGGAIYVGVTCLLTNDTFTGNLAQSGSTTNTSSIAAATGADAFGGAICSSTGTVVSVNTTIALNDAVAGTAPTNNGTAYGGGIFSTNGSVTFINTILTNGASGSNFSGVLMDGGHNLSSDGSCNFTNTGSLNNTDPLLGPLQDNGGPTPTMELLVGSPAIDAADTTLAPLLDQRGIVRPVGAAADSGAFEYYDTNSPPACSDFLSVTNATFGSSSASGTVAVIANYYCNWTASSDSAWLTITSSTNGTGSQVLSYSVTANSGSAVPRVGILTIAGQTLTVAQKGTDVTPPTVTITAPAANAQLTNLTVTVTGTAKDNIGIAAVQYRLENANGIGAYQNATGTTNWTVDLNTLTPGGNTVRVQALDLNSNLSVQVTRTFISVQKQALTVTTNGAGTVSPDLNGQILQLGNTYTVTAKPGTGNVFSNWTGSVTSSVTKLTFVMVSNMVLNATFTTNLFLPVQGKYNGLMIDQTNQMYNRSGYLSLKLASSGGLSGQMIIGGVTYSIKTQVGADGSVAIPLLSGKPKQQVMTADLQFDLTGGSGQVNGTLSDARVVNGVAVPATWVSDLSGDKAGFFTSTNPAPQAGPYTVLFSGGGDGVSQPAGWGYATVKVDALGNLQMSGFLATGTSIGQKTTVSKDGRWPLFVKLSQAGNVSALGWMIFTNLPSVDISGQVVWTKLPLSSAVYYPAGFVDTMPTVGARYVAPTNSANGILGFTNGNFQFSSGSLGDPTNTIINTITLSWDGKVTNTSTNALSATINKTTGAFSGKVTVPGTTTVLPFKGAVIQHGQDIGYGYFLGGRQSGQVLLTH